MALFDNPSTDSGVFNFGIDETAKGYLLETARWAKFLSIVGFVIMALLVLAGIFFTAYLGVGSFGGALGGGLPAGLLIGVYLVLAMLYFFPTFYLFRFSSGIKPAILSADQAQFNSALSNLRNAFRFIGVLMLVLLGFYALIFLVGIATAAMA
jgi:hypothetical protein